MLIVIKDGMLTEDKKESCYRYSGLFKVINRLCGVRIDIWTHLMRGCIINYVH